MLKIGLIGLGNAGMHLANALQRNHAGLQWVFSRDIDKVKRHGQRLRVAYSDSLLDLPSDLDLVLLAVPDDNISEVAQTLSPLLNNALLAHISGATPASALKPWAKRYGVFYPLQSFSKGRKINFREVPICVFASTEPDTQLLVRLGEELSNTVQRINDEQRLSLHVGAVMANNFVNYLYGCSSQICRKADLPFDLLKPLILETANKIIKYDPLEAQTGPAIRHDQDTIDRHLAFLAENESFYQVYKTITLAIEKSR